MIKRVIVIVLDSVGIGELPDAYLYNDQGSNTLCNIVKNIGNLSVNNMLKLGLGNIDGLFCFDKLQNVLGSYGRFMEKSYGKDTITGHWELMGIVLDKPFSLFPNGFPEKLIEKFKNEAGIAGVLGNKPASGTQIIEEYGEEHIKTGYPIIYTSADSVFQIAAHEEVIPLDRLYDICRTARRVLDEEKDILVGRVIARPFVDKKGSFKRTSNRKDFAIDPIGNTVLDYVKQNGLEVIGIGKICDIFNKKGITECVHTVNNMDGIDKIIEYLKRDFEGILFANLVDFDMLYGHRNDPYGYAKALEEFDMRLPEILSLLKEEDVLIITSDHGCDPTTKSTDHSREYIFAILYGNFVRKNVNLGTRKSFADIGATILDMFGLKGYIKGESFWKEIKNY